MNDKDWRRGSHRGLHDAELPSELVCRQVRLLGAVEEEADLPRRVQCSRRPDSHVTASERRGASAREASDEPSIEIARSPAARDRTAGGIVSSTSNAHRTSTCPHDQCVRFVLWFWFCAEAAGAAPHARHAATSHCSNSR